MDFLAKYPRKLAASSKAGAPTYTLVPELYAVHGQQIETGEQPEHLLNDGEIAVFKVEPNREQAIAGKGKVSPVYTLNPGGSLGVPTGLVFIRLVDGLDVKAIKDEVSNAGYKVTETLAYAPNAAWLQAQTEDIADGLNGLAALEKLPNVESVEPQMLMESSRR